MSTDGVHWSRDLGTDQTLGQAALYGVVAIPTGFLAYGADHVASPAGTAQMYFSADGIEWQRLGLEDPSFSGPSHSFIVRWVGMNQLMFVGDPGTRGWPMEYCAMIEGMEPERKTDPDLAGILEELSSREPIFHRPEFGVSRIDFERITAEDFCETGASGRCYSRALVLNELEKRFAAPHPDVWETSDFHCRQLAPGVYLLTYTLLQDHVRRTRRATIWQRTDEGWKIVYHQGTIVQNM